MDIDLEVGILGQDGAGGAGMIEMDVSQEQGIERSKAQAAGAQCPAERFHRGFWAGIDERALAFRFNQQRGYGLRASGPMEINGCKVAHAILSVATRRAGWLPESPEKTRNYLRSKNRLTYAMGHRALSVHCSPSLGTTQDQVRDERGGLFCALQVRTRKLAACSL